MTPQQDGGHLGTSAGFFKHFWLGGVFFMSLVFNIFANDVGGDFISCTPHKIPQLMRPKLFPQFEMEHSEVGLR